jgi:hypothetical protein
MHPSRYFKTRVLERIREDVRRETEDGRGGDGAEWWIVNGEPYIVRSEKKQSHLERLPAEQFGGKSRGVLSQIDNRPGNPPEPRS